MTRRPETSPAWVRALAEGKEPWWTPVFCGLLALAGWLAPRWGVPAAVGLAAYAGSYAVGGAVSLVRSFRSLSERRLDVDLLMLLSAAGAAAIGEFAEGAVLLFLFSLSNSLESRALGRTTRAIEALMELRPDEAMRLAADGSEVRVAADSLAPGDTVRVRPGERIPVDGRVLSGHTAVDQAAITGESMPETRTAGQAVFAGSINVGGTVELVVERPAADSTLARIIRLVEKAREAKAPTQRFIDRFEQGYAASVIFGAAAAIVAPMMLGEPFREAFYRAMTLLVVASPCAVVISTPATILAALAHAARKGLLFKGGAPLEELADLDVVAFDKTGTLTGGCPVVTDVVAFGGAEPHHVLALAAAVERLSEHPLGRAIVGEAARLGLEPPLASGLRNTRGRGVVAQVGDESVAVGRRDFAASFHRLDPGAESAAVERLVRQGKTLVWIAARDAAGVLAIEDEVRPGVKEAIARLSEVGVRRTLLLTGDHEQVALRVAEQVGVDQHRSGLLPEEKVAVLRELTLEGRRVAMVGDGVNDAPALASATVGVAMGIAGTDAALETADLVLVRDELALLPYAIRLARRARRIVRQNLAFACAVIAVLVVVNLVHGLALPIGVVGHEGSTILVVLNGLRVLRPLRD